LGVENAVAFDAEKLTTLGTSDLVKDIIKSVVIHGFEFEDAFESSIRHHSYTVGKQTNILHFSGLSVQKYVWAHKEIQPWGNRIPLQCPQCGALNTFTFLTYHKPTKTYYVGCSYRDCGLGPAGRVPRVEFRWGFPEGSTLLKCAPKYGWLKQNVVVK
jgi:hypothetical protein